MTYLLDTDVVSELRRPHPHPNVKAWFDTVPGERLRLSVLVIGEIARGVAKLRAKDPARAEPYEAWLATLRSQYAGHLVSVDEAVAAEWGRLTAGSGTVPAIDRLLAATALVHRWTLVTRNVADVAGTGVIVLNPWRWGEGLRPEKWRSPPDRTRPDELIASQPVEGPRDLYDPAGDPQRQTTIPYGGG